MGAKQSKRSVDISGKEAEGAGEVAAAGAVGEGRVEQLADADALKPQLNGDAQHIHEPTTDKEKQLDSGTPENEKDATTEKEGMEKENESGTEKDAAPVTNGDSELKAENGESAPAPEEGKKPKKEKVKKKWSLRSISFSRKDKPKQEKKQKEGEPKLNGEPEKLPEEAAEATPETAANEVAEEAKPEAETKDEKTPETPVTEPLTNGSSTPESPKAETPAEESAPTPAPAAAPAPAPAAEPERQEPKAEIKPEQLPVNGLSLDESKPEAPELAQAEESKLEEQPTADTTETVPAPEIPVKKEVCVEQMPLETIPPPLPANPPPSSVASFAATTMALELTDASLVNTAEIVISAPHSIPDTITDKIDVPTPVPQTDPTNIDNVSNNEIVATNDIVATELPTSLKDTNDEKPVEIVKEVELEKIDQAIQKAEQLAVEKAAHPVIEKEQPTIEKVEHLAGEKAEQPLFEMNAEPKIENKEQASVEIEDQPPIAKVEQSVENIKQLVNENVERPAEETQKSLLEKTEQPGIEKVEQSEIDNLRVSQTLISDSNMDTFESIQNECSDTRQATGDQVDHTENKALKQDLNNEMSLEAAPVIDFDKMEEINEITTNIPDSVEDIPLPPPPIEDEVPDKQYVDEQMIDATIQEKIEIVQRETVINTNHISEITDMNGLNTENLNGNDETVNENAKNKTKDSHGNLIGAIECNGNIEEVSKLETEEMTAVANDSTEESGAAATLDDSAPPSLSEANESLAAADCGSNEASEAFPPPPSERELEAAPAASPDPPRAADTPQEPLPVSDKLVDLIPEVPVMPELKTETLAETTSNVAVAN